MENNAITSVFNYRISIILVETVIVYFIYNYFNIRLTIDFTIVSIAIVFPLVFSITSAYQRRQESIETFAEFRNKIIDISNIFYAVNGVGKEDYNTLYSELLCAQKLLVSYIKSTGKNQNFELLRQKRKSILLLLNSYKHLFNEREKDSLIQVKNELFLSAEKLRGTKIHETPISLRKYCLIFIYLSPFLYDSQLVVGQSSFDYTVETVISLFFSLLISFVLMALYNVQEYIENPFDQKGLDDLKIDEMEVNPWESLLSD